MKNKFLSLLFGVGLFCGEAQALPQDWPCDEFKLSNDGISESSLPTDEPKAYQFRGNNGNYEVVVFHHHIDPEFVHASCGNAGCRGKIKNLKTGKEEYMYFDCSYDQETKLLECYRISGDEYLFTKASDDEYRAQLCDGGYYKYFKYSECTGCTCIVKDSRPRGSSDWDMNCIRENENIRCFRYYGYEAWRHFKNDFDDYKNCVGLGI